MTISDGGGGDPAGGGGAAPPAAAPAADPAAAAPSAWYETLTDQGLRANPMLHRYGTVDDLAKGYVNLEKRFGIDPARRIDLPADPNDADGMRAVYAKLGLPEKPDGYGFKLDDKASEADKALVGSFAETAHKLGLPADMAKGLMSWFQDQVAASETAKAEAFKAQAEAGKAALTKEWGQAYEPKSREIGAALNKYGDPELVAELEGQLGNYPNLARFLGRLMDRMAEPGAAGGLSGDAAGADRALTPNQAKAAITALETDPVKGVALRTKTHPQHKAVVDERTRLIAMTVTKQA